MCPHCVRPWIQKDRTPQGVPSRRREIYLVSLIIGKNGDNYRCLHLCSGKSHNCSIFLIKVVISAGCKVMIKWKWILLMSRWGVGRNVLRTTLCRELQLFSNSISIISLWSRCYPHFSGEENRARLNSDLFVWLQSSHSLCYTVWLPWSPVLFFYESTVTPSVPTAPNHEQICREWVQVIWRETLFISALNFTVLSVHACVCLWWLNSTFLVNQYGPPHSMHLAGSFLPSFLQNLKLHQLQDPSTGTSWACTVFLLPMAFLTWSYTTAVSQSRFSPTMWLLRNLALSDLVTQHYKRHSTFPT